MLFEALLTEIKSVCLVLTVYEVPHTKHYLPAGKLIGHVFSSPDSWEKGQDNVGGQYPPVDHLGLAVEVEQGHCHAQLDIMLRPEALHLPNCLRYQPPHAQSECWTFCIVHPRNTHRKRRGKTKIEAGGRGLLISSRPNREDTWYARGLHKGVPVHRNSIK